MTAFSLAFFSGVLILQFFSALPSLSWAGVALASCPILFLSKVRGYHLILAFLLGFAWCLGCAHAIAAFSLLPAWEGKPLWIRGEITSLPRVSPYQSSFVFHLESIQNGKERQRVATSINLSWSHAPHLQVGDEWLLPVRLKKIHSTMNPGGFDFEAWAFQKGIRAKGYVLEQEKPLFIAEHYLSYPIAHLRQYIQTQAQQRLPASRTAPWLQALMIGERTGVSPSDWEVLRNTGTNHLMAIAGLHIGFMAALAHGLTVRLWRRPRLIALLPTAEAGVCASLVMAGLYSALAGFSIPTQRALVMVTIYLLATLCRRVLPLWQAWSLALLIVLLLNPLSLLSSSFWLSFATLALIIYGLGGRLAPSGGWWQWGRPQWVLAVGLLPLSLWLFMEYSLVSFLANMVAIPWVGFLILPLCFLSVILLLVCPGLASYSLLLADKSLGLLWSLLTWFSQLPWSTWQQSLPNYGYLLAATGGVLVLLLPAGFPGRGLGLLWLLPVLSFKPVRPDFGELRFSLLDVGQGLSAVVQTQNHVLVFDTGARRGPESDMGESVVLPFLRSQSVKQIDMLVVSHGDNDHSGGAQALLKQLPVRSLQTSVPGLFPSRSADYCLAGKAWDWDGVHFAFLHPTVTQLNLDNDSSCVLLVATKTKRLLLPGDIEKAAEKVLLASSPNTLSAAILVAPHHGSKTSGLRAFVGRVHPQYVLYAIGYRNRYHFPYPGVVATYREFGAIQLDTSALGAIQFVMGRDSLYPLEFYRPSHQRYWNLLY